jgi:hypothetical protein
MQAPCDQLLHVGPATNPATGFNGAADVAISGETGIASDVARPVFALHAGRRIAAKIPLSASPPLRAA